MLEFLEGLYYTGAASTILAVSGLIISLWKKHRHPKLLPLIFFFGGYILDQLIISLIHGINIESHLRRNIHAYTDSFDTVIEFLALFFVIRNSINSDKIRKGLSILLPVFISSIIIFFIYYRMIGHQEIDQYFLQTIFTIQAFILCVACIFYYKDLFKTEPKLDLTRQPSFWAVTGLAFFMLCTFPFSIWGLYLVKANRELYNQLYSLFNIFYCILFLMIIKAYFCKQETSQEIIENSSLSSHL